MPKLKVPTPIETKMLCKVDLINETASRIVYVSISSKPLTKTDKELSNDVIILYPLWVTKIHKDKEYEFKKTIILPAGYYYMVYIIEDLETRRVIQLSHLKFNLVEDSEMAFVDKRERI